MEIYLEIAVNFLAYVNISHRLDLSTCFGYLHRNPIFCKKREVFVAPTIFYLHAF